MQLVVSIVWKDTNEMFCIYVELWPDPMETKTTVLGSFCTIHHTLEKGKWVVGTQENGETKWKWLRTPVAHDNQQWSDTFMHNNLNQPAGTKPTPRQLLCHSTCTLPNNLFWFGQFSTLNYIQHTTELVNSVWPWMRPSPRASSRCLWSTVWSVLLVNHTRGITQCFVYV